MRNLAVLSLGVSLVALPILAHARIAETAQDTCPIKVGTTIPAVTLKTVDKKDFDLAAAVKKKPTILVFYRGGWCAYCNVQLQQLAVAEPKLLEMGYQLIALSPDRPERLAESILKHKLKYLLLSDSLTRAAQAFGVAFKVDDETIQKYLGHGTNLELSSGETHHVLPVPSVFVLDTSGEIKFAYSNPNYRVRLDPELLLTAAKISLPSKK